MPFDEKQISRSIQRDFRKEIWRKFISAVKTYHLIEAGDHIAVCLSGGKDSLLLAVCMRELQKYSEVPFSVSYLTMDPGYSPANREKTRQNAHALYFEPKVFESPIFEALQNVKASPCHVCAAMRRGYLYKEAQNMGCNKIALGHHLDDVVETVLLSLLYGGEYKTMMPRLNSKNYAGMQLIRPLYLVREKDIIAWKDAMGLECLTCACVVTKKEDGGKRKRVKNLIAQLESETHAVIGNIFHSLEHVNLQTVLGYQMTTESEIVHVTEQAADVDSDL